MAERSESDFKNAFGTGKDRLLNKVGWLVGEAEAVSPAEQFLLPVDLVEFLRPAFESLGFPLEPQPSIVKDHKLDPFKFYKIKLDDGYIALFFLRNKMLQNPNVSSNLFWMAITWTMASPDGIARGMFYFSDSDYKDDVYNSVKSSFEGAMKLKLVEFFDRRFAERLFALETIEDIASLLGERLGLNKVFTKPAASPTPTPTAVPPVSTSTGKPAPQGEEKYLDFDLAISPTGHVVASSKEEGDVPADISTEVPDDIQLALELIDQNKTTEKMLKKVGASLYNWLFPDDIHTHLHQTEASARNENYKLRLRLRVENPTIASLPLELLYREKGNYFLSTNPDTVLSRYLNLPLPPERVRQREGPLHLLIILSEPGDLAQFDAPSWDTLIREALAKPLADNSMSIRTVARATRKEIRNALLEKKPDIIQFVGHGIYKDDKGQIALMDDLGDSWLVDEQAFANLFQGHDDNLGLICLTSCESAQSTAPQSFRGIGPQLVERGVPAVVAMQYEVKIKSAKVFLEDFYTSIAAHKPVDWAVQMARNAVSIEFNLDNREFATPVLYMRAEDGNIF
jgi:CHAT domain-containing protein